MQKINIHLPKYRLALEFRLIKRRKSSMDEPYIPTLKRLNLKYRVGNKVQKLLRYLFEHKRTKTLLGTNIALMLMVSTVLPNNAIGNNQIETLTSINGTNNPIKTEVGTQYPVANIRITQGYKFYHPGLDLDGITGDPIKPIKKGKVIDIGHSNFAYGNSITIDHGNNLTSLYAHLSKIDISKGQEVTTNTKLGEMGSTGRSTGSHLHLEIRDHGIPINPFSVLPK